MSAFTALVSKEVRSLFTSPIAYAVIAVFIVLSGYSFVVSLILAKQATLVHIFFQSAVQLILLVPLITMRQFAEERRSGTIELLLTLPTREIDIVLAKFIACMVVLLVMTGLTLIYAAVLAAYAEPDFGPIYSGYVGLVMFAAALVSIGLAISALTANQIVAAVVSLGLFGLLWAVDTLAALLPQPYENWLLGLSRWLISHHSLLVRCTSPTSASSLVSFCLDCSSRFARWRGSERCTSTPSISTGCSGSSVGWSRS